MVTEDVACAGLSRRFVVGALLAKI
jgi:hypothetical protein